MANLSIRNIVFIFFTSVFLIPVTISPAFSADELIITSGRQAPFTQADGKGIFQLLVKEVFKRMGRKAKVVALASERSLINANAGIDDGNIARVKGMEKQYPNLIRVPEKVLVYDFLAFSRNKDLKIDGWKSLSAYNVAYITGWKILEKNITNAKSITRVRSPKQLFTLLKNDRTEVIIFDRWGGLWWIKSLGLKVYPLKPPVISKDMFLYMHKKHTAIVPHISKTIAEMKKDGSYQRILDNALQALQ